MSSFKWLFGVSFFIFFVFVPAFLSGQTDSIQNNNVSAWDEGVVDYRQPPFSQIETWQSDRQYYYDRHKGPGLWDFLFSRLLGWLRNFSSDRPWHFYLLLFLGGFLVLFLVLRYLNIPVSGVFVVSGQSINSGLHFDDHENDFSSDKLNEMLQMFRSNGAYRDAVRIMFLLYLKELNDRGIIVMRRNKTNHDYYLEIDSLQEREVFKKRKRLFDVIWYGHVDVSSVGYRKVVSVFTNEEEGRVPK
jgi:hypothetical protein